MLVPRNHECRNSVSQLHTDPVFLQIKTLKNPDGAYGAMKKAVDALGTLPSPPSVKKLHILKKPGTSSNQLRQQLDDYIATLAIDKKVTVVIQEFELTP